MPHDKFKFSINRYNRRALRRDLRSNGTAAEAVLWRCLRAKQVEGVQWRRQFSIDAYILDFYAPQLKLCIELDGEPHYTPEGSAYDMQREEWLLRVHGIRTIQFENIDVFRHNESIVEYIRKVTREILKERKHPISCPSINRGGVVRRKHQMKRDIIITINKINYEQRTLIGESSQYSRLSYSRNSFP